MLEEISISNLGVIKKAQLPFTEGLTVITGETGAGKTMVLTALHLLMGRRADQALVRYGAEKASAEGCWQLTQPDLIKAIEDTGAEVEEGQVFINRTIANTGKSRAVLGGKTTPSKVLAKVTEDLVNIHGQADQIRLKNTDAQLEALDRYAGSSNAKLLDTYRKTFYEWRRESKNVADLKTNQRAREREYANLAKLLNDYYDLDPKVDEIETLEQEIALLAKADDLKEGAQQALALLNPDDYEMTPPSAQLAQINTILSKLARHDENMSKIAVSVGEAIDQLDDITSALENYCESMDGDRLERLYAAQERVQNLKAFEKRNHHTLQEVEDELSQWEARLKELDPNINSLEQAEARLQAQEEKLTLQANKLSKNRLQASRELTVKVNEELAGLAMGSNKMVIEINPTAFTSKGIDELQFSLQTGGSPTPRPIAKAASGGELSRVMLALEVVLANPEITPTFVFDEVDSGVGGSTAIEIGKRLAKLAQEAQVIVVTHLPQVACFSDNHLVVTKDSSDEVTETTVRQLNEKEKVKELTRMLSGLSGSEHGNAHARELMALAEAYKAG